LVGKLERLEGKMARLADSFDDKQTTIASSEVKLEGSRASFARCLRHLLGPRYTRFEELRSIQEARFLAGTAQEELLGKMHQVLIKASPLKLSPDLTANVAGRLSASNDTEHNSVVVARPVMHCFDSARSKKHEYPWSGMLKYGPFSRDSFSNKSPRIVVFCPDTLLSKAEHFISLLRDGVQEIQHSQYPSGFSQTYGLTNVKFEFITIPWLDSRDRAPEQLFHATIKQYLEQIAERDEPKPTAAFVVMPDEHADAPPAKNPYYASKSLLLMAGIPVQQIRRSTMLKDTPSLQYTLKNISIALYAKMNGTPWTVDHDLTVNDEIVIGMGMAELSSSRFERRQRFMGVTTVFQRDGSYLLSNISEECAYDEYPTVLKNSTLSVLERVKRENGWRPRDVVRIVFHAAKPLRKVEMADIMADCVEKVGQEQRTEFAFVTVTEDHPFVLSDLSKAAAAREKGKYVPARGTIVQIGRYTRLLSTLGPSLIKRPKGPLPRPLLVNIHPKSTFKSLDYLAEQVLKFTSLSWRSSDPAHKPVTIYYPELIAENLAKLRSVPNWSAAMLNMNLRSSRWFL